MKNSEVAQSLRSYGNECVSPLMSELHAACLSNAQLNLGHFKKAPRPPWSGICCLQVWMGWKGRGGDGRGGEGRGGERERERRERGGEGRGRGGEGRGGEGRGRGEGRGGEGRGGEESEGEGRGGEGRGGEGRGADRGEGEGEGRGGEGRGGDRGEGEGEGRGEVALSAHGSMHSHKLVRVNWKLMLWISL